MTDDRVQIQGNVLTANAPAFPGGPPDGQTAVRTIDFTFPASTHYITTPPTCPTGQWTSQASFSFADGTTQHVSSAMPCTIPKPARPHNKHHRSKKRHRRAKSKKAPGSRDSDYNGDNH